MKKKRYCFPIAKCKIVFLENVFLHKNLKLTRAHSKSTASRMSSWCPMRVTPSSSSSWWVMRNNWSPAIISLSKFLIYCCRQSSRPEADKKYINKSVPFLLLNTMLLLDTLMSISRITRFAKLLKYTLVKSCLSSPLYLMPYIFRRAGISTITVYNFKLLLLQPCWCLFSYGYQSHSCCMTKYVWF